MSKVNYSRGVLFLDVPVASGALDIKVGDNLNYNADGYVKAASDTEGEAFAGVAMEALTAEAADNATAGTYSVRIIPAHCGNIVRRSGTFTRAAAVPGTKLYTKSAAELATTATKSVVAGIVAAFVSETECDVAI